jgi:hypothetical protein
MHELFRVDPRPAHSRHVVEEINYLNGKGNARTVQRRVALTERLRIIDGSTPEGGSDRKVSASLMATRVAPLLTHAGGWGRHGALGPTVPGGHLF